VSDEDKQEMLTCFVLACLVFGALMAWIATR
jgi:hypothetical protein